MRREILHGADFCAVTEDGRLVEYIPLEDGAGQSRGGDIVLGKAERMMPGLACAFVDIGRRRSGFLPLKEDSRSFQGGPLRSGEKLVLQIKKEETGEKGAFLTRDVTLPGTLVILMPMNRYIGVSGQVADEGERRRLKEIGSRVAGDRFGLVLRLAAEGAEEKAGRAEAENLLDRWNALLAEAEHIGVAGTVLYHDSPLDRLREDYLARGVDAVRETETLEGDLARQRKLAGERKVPLPGGGNLVIDRCEAMTVIDVNTAAAHAGGSKEATVLETNMEACEAAAEQIRLRDLAGIIIIDFIDLESPEDRDRVEERLRECFARDRVKTVIHGWTSLGLMEMTRKRR